jgi:hypothetical protein
MSKITLPFFLLISFVIMAQDTTPPNAVCQNITVQLDVTGNAVITALDVDGGSTDNVAIASYSVSPSAFNCANTGPNNVILTVTDTSGNTDSCTAIVTVADTQPPTVLCQDITIQLDASGMASIIPSDIDNGSNDNCGIVLTASQLNFDCSHVGTNNVTLTATDPSGNAANCVATVTVNELTDPVVAVCQDITVFLDSNGMVSIADTDIDGGSTGAESCGTLSFSASQTSFNCNNVFNPPPTDLIITGVLHGPRTGNTPKAIEILALTDIPDLTLFGLGIADDGGGSDGQEFTFPAGSVTAGTYLYIASENTEFDVFFGFSPDAVSPSITVDGNDAVELYFNNTVIDVFGEIGRDGAGQPWEYTSGWIYRKNETSAGNTFNLADWFFSGTNIWNTAMTNATALLPFPTATYSYTQAGTASPTSVTLTVTNSNGISDSCTANVTVRDFIAPVANCADITVQLDSNGEAVLTEIQIDAMAGASTDNCSVRTYTVEPSAFFCNNIGSNTVLVTVNDVFGNQASCNAVVTVEDNIPPTVNCENITVQLDVLGMVNITPDDVDDGSTDACGIASRTIDINSFDCSNIGPNNVILTVTDVNGNSSSCTAVVTVEDTVPPDAVCSDITIQLDASGMATITANDIDGGSNAACGIASISANMTTFSCNELGANTVILTVNDSNGNSASCSAVVTVEDTIPPVASAMDITVQLGPSGSVTVAGSALDNGSSDNCSIASIMVSPDTFSCTDVGSPVPVVVTVTDQSGNTDSANASITVEDSVAPTAVCNNITLPLDASGSLTITPADIDGGSTVSCGNATLSIDTTTFDCNSVGPNNVQLSVTNSNGITSSCTATVTIVDNTPPSVICNDISVTLDSTGNASITVNDIDAGSTDACGIASRSLNVSTFDCSDAGPNNVILTVTDVNGNSASCTAVVTVMDSIPPNAVCQNITVQLNAAGTATISAAALDGGSTDLCGIASRTIDIDTFNCNNIGANAVTLTVTDTSGNTDSCTAIVTVEDITPPTAVCQNITVALDASGNGFITAAQLDGGSSDACGIGSMSVSNTIFNCNTIGANPVLFTVTDVNGNSSSCTAIVTVTDMIPPTVVCQNITVQLDASGSAFITATDIDGGSFDACGISTVSINTNSFDCDDLGANNVVLSVTDVNGNTASCTAVVTVQDNLDPVVSCPPAQTEIVPTGGTFIIPDYFGIGEVTATDNCTSPLTLTTQNPVPGTELGLGTYTISTTVEDTEGNTASCSFQLTVDVILGMEPVGIPGSLSLIPNPATNSFQVIASEDIQLEKISIFEISGRLVLEVYPEKGTTQHLIDVSGFANSVYLLVIKTETGYLTKQLIKE